MYSGFKHRQTDDGNVDSICLRCFRTIGSHECETALSMMEARHECDPVDLMRFQSATKETAHIIEFVRR